MVSTANRQGPENWTTATAHTFGEFRGQARWIRTPVAITAPNEVEGFAEVISDGEDNELGIILSAIAEEVQRDAAAASAGVIAEFVGRMRHARKFLPRELLQGALQSLQEALKAALTLIKRQAAVQLAERRKVAVKKYSKRFRIIRHVKPHPHGKSPEGPSQ